MNRKLFLVLIIGAALLFGVVVSAAANVVKDSGVAVKIEIPEAILSFLGDNGIDVSALVKGMEVPESVRDAILLLSTDDDARAEMNGIANKALREARETTGSPAYLEVGPLYWGYWFSGDV